MGLFFIAYQTDVACSQRDFLCFPVTHWVECQMLQDSAELLMNAREVSGSASATGKGIIVAEHGRDGGCCCLKMERRKHV